MAPGRITEDNIERAVVSAGLVLLGGSAAVALALGSVSTAAGIAAGGIISLANFYWLKSVIHRALGLAPAQVQRFALLRYLIRLAVTGAILYLLIVRAGMNVFGLLIGLSVIVAGIILVSIRMSIQKGG